MQLRVRLGGRVEAVQGWLERRAQSSIGRLALLWYSSYFQASRNSGSAATVYAALSIVPVALAVVGASHAAGATPTVFADHLITRMKLSGTTANLLRQTFGTSSSNALAATLVAVVGFLIWGLGIGQIYQDVYARAWGLKLRSLADQGRFAIWFVVVAGLIGVGVISADRFRAAGWLALIPVWVVGSLAFWLWTPRYLMHGHIGLGALLPGALLACFVLGGAAATSPLWVGPWLDQDAKYFGSFGITIGLLAWWLVFITLSMICAVFSPVWAQWRGKTPSGNPVVAA